MNWFKTKKPSEPTSGPIVVSEVDPSEDRKIFIHRMWLYILDKLPDEVVVVGSFLIIGILLSYGILYVLAATHAISNGQIQSIKSAGIPLPGVSSRQSQGTPAGSPLGRSGSSPNGSGGSGQNSPSPDNTGKPNKHLITGVIDQGSVPSSSWLDHLGGAVIYLKWSSLEQTNGNIQFNDVSGPLDKIASYDQSHPDHQVYAKLRIAGGVNSPGWVDSLAGSFSYTGGVTSNISGQVPKFWDSRVIAAWSYLMQQLANKFNSSPYLSDVDVGGLCSTATNEPMVRQTEISSNVSSMLDAGYSFTNDQYCQQQQLIIAAKYWTNTYSSESFSNFDAINPTEKTGTSSCHDGSYPVNGSNQQVTICQDPGFSDSYISYGYQLMGLRWVPGNNELGRSLTNQANNASVDNYLFSQAASHQGSRLYFQLASPANIVNTCKSSNCKTIAQAITITAQSIDDTLGRNVAYFEVLGNTYTNPQLPTSLLDSWNSYAAKNISGANLGT